MMHVEYLLSALPSSALSSLKLFPAKDTSVFCDKEAFPSDSTMPAVELSPAAIFSNSAVK